MALRCLLFSSDQGTAEPICQVLAGLGVEGEHCTEGVAAVEQVTSQPFQIVIIDWDNQPEAGLLLTTARERKASERPLTLAIVSDDVSVPKALQAGANSILRKPIMVNQVKDTLTTARDLLRAKQESAMAAAAGTAVASSAAAPATGLDAGHERSLRAGEFLQPSGTTPGTHFVTDADANHALEPAAEPVDPLQDLEPVAASVAEAKPASAPPRSPDEPRGLQYYLNARAAAAPQVPAPVPSPHAAPAKPEMLGFDQTPVYSEAETVPVPAARPESLADRLAASVSAPTQDQEHEQKAEAKLFAYIAGEDDGSDKSEKEARPRFRLGKGPIIGAVLLAGCAMVAAPQAPWHPQIQALWGRGQHTVHVWLNPQPVTTAPAPESHENFGRAGDEYKLPVAENIPDATTDPSQIHVVPVVDPTAKKPNNANPTADQTAGQDAANTNPTDAAPPAGTQATADPGAGNQAQNPVQGSQPVQPVPDAAQPASAPAAGGTATTPGTTVSVPVTPPPHSDPPSVVPPTPAPVVAQPAPVKAPPPQYVSAPANVPSSLKSQMASMTPDASGNKPPEAAMQSIEPVVIPEAAERALLTDQPAIDYPATAKGQQGTVVLQILVGRDGTVQDAKFMQGSLAFARTAIDGVKQWKFKPYSMNGRPVSVQSTMTMSFKP